MPTKAAKTRVLMGSGGKGYLRYSLSTRRSSGHAAALGAPGGGGRGRTSRPVADARNSLDNAGLSGVVLDLGAQARDVHVNIAARQVVRACRDGLGDLGPREGPARSAHEKR